MSKYVLDASALLALLNNEAGAQRVREIAPESSIGTVNVCETAGKLVSAGMSPEDARTSIELINLEVVTFDAELAYQAGTLIIQTKGLGLSLGDRACLALGLAQKSIIVTADQAWARLKLDVDIEILRGKATAIPDKGTHSEEA